MTGAMNSSCVTLELNDLLERAGASPEQHKVLVFRHCPIEPRLRDVLPWLAADNHDLFNAYQRSQIPKVERALQQSKFVASFIGHEARRAVFIGLYEVRGCSRLSNTEFWNLPEMRELKKHGMSHDVRDSYEYFHLDLLPFLSHWKGRLTVEWPPPERSWYRWADRNKIPIHSIHEDSILDRQMPAWNTICLRWDDLKVLPKRWRDTLSEWRGIYFILDEADGKGYVGSAYGKDNLLGRWEEYAATGHGENKKLRERDPSTFLFTILQRVSPDLPPEEVIAIEGSWKDRLHTHEFGLNSN